MVWFWQRCKPASELVSKWFMLLKSENEPIVLVSLSVGNDIICFSTSKDDVYLLVCNQSFSI